MARGRYQVLSMAVHPLSYMGVNPVSPQNFTINNRPPTATDAHNVLIGDTWLDNSSYPTPPKTENFWLLVSLTGGNATWVNFASGGDLKTLTGNVGGAVAGDGAQNINTVGDGVGITVTGNPGTHTLTWSLVGGGVATQSYLTDDALVEVPNAAGQLTVTGTGVTSAGNVYSNMNTLRGVNNHVLGIALNDSIGQPSTNMAATQGMYALGGANNFVTDRFMYNYGTRNTFLGYQSGNLAFTVANATDNTCIGTAAGNALVGGGAVQGALNTLVGSTTGNHITNGTANVYIGSGSGSATTTGGSNSSVGTGSFSNITTGGSNCGLGFDVGNNYTGAESGNINIGFNNFGATGENSTIRIGLIAATAGTNDIFIGQNCGNTTMTVANARNNVFIGTNGATALTTGNQNVCIGSTSGSAITSAPNCVYVGYASGIANTTGQQNTGLGSQNLNAVTTGQRNSSVGDGGLIGIITGSNNTTLGYSTGSNFTGAESSNVIIGSGQFGKVGEVNIIRIGTIGQAAGDENIFIGRDSGNITYTGGAGIANIFVGNTCGASLTTGHRNLGIGTQGNATSLTSGNSNTFVGCLSGNLLTTGANNCCLGDSALQFLLTGNNNIVIGTQGAQNYVAAESGNIIIGPTNSAVVGDNNTLRIASGVGGGLTRAFIQGIRGITTGNNDAIAVLVDSANQLGTVSSSREFKDNINDMASYSDILYKMRPVTFNFKQHDPSVVSVGLIAEEVEEVMPRLVAYQEDKPISVKYHDLPAMLLNELQKLEKRVSELEKECKCQNSGSK